MLQGSMAELKLADLPRAASRQVCGAYVALQREVMEHLDLKRQLAAKQALVGSKRALEQATGGEGGGAAEDAATQAKRQRTARRQFDE